MSYIFKSTDVVLPSYMKPVAEGVVEKKREARARAIAEAYDIIRFKGGHLCRKHGEMEWLPLTSDTFARIVYEVVGGMVTSGQVRDLEHWFRAVAPDYSGLGHLIAMGTEVWDMGKAKFDRRLSPDKCVYQTRYPADGDTTKAWKFMLDLAKGRPELAQDMLKGLAPLLLARRPTGVIWFYGNGANGKSSLIDAIYRIFGTHLVSLTIANIEDGRDTPILNGALGNIVRESSEARVEDAERYKALGTHEGFSVHRFHSQEPYRVTGDLHHVFNANNIPTFADKSHGTRRRTEIIPFENTFKDDAGFNDRTFDTEFLVGLLTLLTEAAQEIHENGTRYNFSSYTLRAKGEWSDESNTAEAYIRYLEDHSVEAFTNYVQLKMTYENWCLNQGDIPLGLTNLKRAVKNIGEVERQSYREGDLVKNHYVFKWGKTPAKDLVTLDNGFQVGLKVAPSPEVASKVKEDSEW